MKVVYGLLLVALIATTVLAQDVGGNTGDNEQVGKIKGNKRVDKSGILLKRCRADGVTVTECCKDLGKKDHALYKGTKNMCCSRALGMWLPPARREHRGKWCSLKRSTELVQGNLKGVKDLSNTLRKELENLHDQRQDTKNNLMNQYVQNEKVEKGKHDERADQQKLLAATRVTYNEKDQQVQAAQEEFQKVKEDFKTTRDTMKQRVSKVMAKLSQAIKAVFKAAATLAPKRANLKEELEAFDKCNQDKSDEKSGYNVLNKQFRALQKEIDNVNTGIENAEKEKAQVEADTEKKTKELNTELDGIDKESKEFQKEALAAKAAFLKVRNELNQAQQNFEKNLLDGVSVFLEVSGPIDATCEGLCKKFSNMKVGDAGFFRTANRFLRHTTRSTATLFKILTNVHDRLVDLLKKDKDLHQQIMIKLERKIAGLKAAIVALKRDINRLTRKAESLNKRTNLAKITMDWYVKVNTKKVAKIEARVTSKNEQLKRLNNQIDGIDGQIKVAMAKNIKCKKQLSNLKTRSAALKQKKAAAENELIAAKKVLEDAEDEAQTAKEQGEADITRLQNDIADAQKKSNKFQTDATKLKKAKASYEKKIEAFQKDEEEINGAESQEEDPAPIKTTGSTLAEACASAGNVRSVCNTLTHNDLVDKVSGYKKPRFGAMRVGCVWSRNKCVAKRRLRRPIRRAPIRRVSTRRASTRI
jgi:chromosome segregation ATPase